MVTYEELQEFLTSMEMVIIVAIIIFFLMILIKSSDKWIVFYGLLLSPFLILLFSTTLVSGLTFENDDIGFVNDDLIDGNTYINCNIYVESTINKKPIENSFFYDSVIYTNTSNTDTLDCENVFFNGTNFELNTGSGLELELGECRVNNSWVAGTVRNFEFYFESSGINPSYFENVTGQDYDLFVGSAMVFYNFTNNDTMYYQQTSSEGRVYFLLKVDIVTNGDYVFIENETFGLENKLVNGSNYIKGFELSAWNNNNFIQETIDWNVSVVWDWQNISQDQQAFSTKWYNFTVFSIINLTLDIRNSLGNPVNNVSVSIRNNDTTTGYYLTVNGIGYQDVQLGNLFFHVSQSDNDLETRLFEITLSQNTTVVIYLNLTDTIDFDMELIDYEIAQLEEVNARNREALAAVVFWFLTGIILFIVIWYAIGKKLVTEGF